MKITTAKLNAYTDCPRKFWFRYIRDLKGYGGPWAHYVTGNGVHHGLAAQADALAAGADTAQARQAAFDAILAGWDHVPFRDPDHSRDWQARVVGWVARHLDAHPDTVPDAPPDTATASDTVEDTPPGHALDTLVRVPNAAGVERKFSARLPGTRHTLEARTDRVDFLLGPDGEPVELVPVDYKAGKEPVTDAEAYASWQLAIQGFTVSRTLGLPCRRAELVHVPTGTVGVVPFTRERAQRHLDRIAGTADAIETATAFVADNNPGGRMPREEMEEMLDARDADDRALAFPATVSGLCPTCPFLAWCGPAREARKTRADPWAYLPKEDAPTLDPGR